MASSVKLINTISVDIRDHEVVIFDFSETVYMDDSAALVVEQLIDVAIAENTDCVVMGLEGLPATALQGLNALSGVPADHVVADLDGARGTSPGDCCWRRSGYPRRGGMGSRLHGNDGRRRVVCPTAAAREPYSVRPARAPVCPSGDTVIWPLTTTHSMPSGYSWGWE